MALNIQLFVGFEFHLFAAIRVSLLLAMKTFRPSCMNQASEWHKRFKEGSESVRDDERCGRSKEVNTPQLIGQRVTMLRF